MPSKQKLATRGRFYNEDDLVDYDVLDYDIDVAASPDRQWIDGRATLRIKVRSYVARHADACGWPIRWSSSRSSATSTAGCSASA